MPGATLCFLSPFTVLLSLQHFSFLKPLHPPSPSLLLANKPFLNERLLDSDHHIKLQHLHPWICALLPAAQVICQCSSIKLSSSLTLLDASPSHLLKTIASAILPLYPLSCIINFMLSTGSFPSNVPSFLPYQNRRETFLTVLPLTVTIPFLCSHLWQNLKALSIVTFLTLPPFLFWSKPIRFLLHSSTESALGKADDLHVAKPNYPFLVFTFLDPEQYLTLLISPSSLIHFPSWIFPSTLLIGLFQFPLLVHPLLPALSMLECSRAQSSVLSSSLSVLTFVSDLNLSHNFKYFLYAKN